MSEKKKEMYKQAAAAQGGWNMPDPTGRQRPMPSKPAPAAPETKTKTQPPATAEKAPAAPVQPGSRVVTPAEMTPVQSMLEHIAPSAGAQPGQETVEPWSLVCFQPSEETAQFLAEWEPGKPVPSMETLKETFPHMQPPIFRVPGEAQLCTTPVMAQVPVQKWGEVYEADTGLSRGTIFPALDLPFLGKGDCRHE